MNPQLNAGALAPAEPRPAGSPGWFQNSQGWVSAVKSFFGRGKEATPQKFAPATIGKDSKNLRVIAFSAGGVDNVFAFGLVHAFLVTDAAPPHVIAGTSSGSVVAAMLADVLQAGSASEDQNRTGTQLAVDTEKSLNEKRDTRRLAQVTTFRAFLDQVQRMPDAFRKAALPDFTEVSARAGLKPLDSPTQLPDEKKSRDKTANARVGLTRLINGLLRSRVKIGELARILRLVLDFKTLDEWRWKSLRRLLPHWPWFWLRRYWPAGPAAVIESPVRLGAKLWTCARIWKRLLVPALRDAPLLAQCFLAPWREQIAASHTNRKLPELLNQFLDTVGASQLRKAKLILFEPAWSKAAGALLTLVSFPAIALVWAALAPVCVVYLLGQFMCGVVPGDHAKRIARYSLCLLVLAGFTGFAWKHWEGIKALGPPCSQGLDLLLHDPRWSSLRRLFSSLVLVGIVILPIWLFDHFLLDRIHQARRKQIARVLSSLVLTLAALGLACWFWPGIGAHWTALGREARDFWDRAGSVTHLKTQTWLPVSWPSAVQSLGVSGYLAVIALELALLLSGLLLFLLVCSWICALSKRQLFAKFLEGFSLKPDLLTSGVLTGLLARAFDASYYGKTDFEQAVNTALGGYPEKDNGPTPSAGTEQPLSKNQVGTTESETARRLRDWVWDRAEGPEGRLPKTNPILVLPVAADLETGSLMALEPGVPIVKALVAACSLPPLFEAQAIEVTPERESDPPKRQFVDAASVAREPIVPVLEVIKRLYLHVLHPPQAATQPFDNLRLNGNPSRVELCIVSPLPTRRLRSAERIQMTADMTPTERQTEEQRALAEPDPDTLNHWPAAGTLYRLADIFSLKSTHAAKDERSLAAMYNAVLRKHQLDTGQALFCSDKDNDQKLASWHVFAALREIEPLKPVQLSVGLARCGGESAKRSMLLGIVAEGCRLSMSMLFRKQLSGVTRWGLSVYDIHEPREIIRRLRQGALKTLEAWLWRQFNDDDKLPLSPTATEQDGKSWSDTLPQRRLIAKTFNKVIEGAVMPDAELLATRPWMNGEELTKASPGTSEAIRLKRKLLEYLFPKELGTTSIIPCKRLQSELAALWLPGTLEAAAPPGMAEICRECRFYKNPDASWDELAKAQQKSKTDPIPDMSDWGTVENAPEEAVNTRTLLANRATWAKEVDWPRTRAAKEPLPHGERKTRPTISMIFSGGVFRGVFQVGVLNALSEANIKPDLVAGASVGTIMAALAARVFTENDDSKRRRRVAGIASTFLAIDRLVLTDRFADFVRRLTLRAGEASFSMRDADHLFRQFDQGDWSLLNRRSRRVLAGIHRLLYLDPLELVDLLGMISPSRRHKLEKRLILYAQDALDRAGIGMEVLGAEPLEQLIAAHVLEQPGNRGAKFSEFLSSYGMQFIATTTNLTTGALDTLGSFYSPERLPALVPGLLASSAFPAVFRPRLSWELRAATGSPEELVDGGISDNLPIIPVYRFLFNASTAGWMAARPTSETGTPVPHLLFTASLEPMQQEGHDQEKLKRLTDSWPALLKRVGQLRYNVKVDNHSQAQDDLRRIHEILVKQGKRPEIDLLDLHISCVKPQWLCPTFAFHPMLGFRRSRQAASIAHGCASTFVHLVREQEQNGSWSQHWWKPMLLRRPENTGLQESGRPSELLPCPADNAGNCCFVANKECPFSRQSLNKLRPQLERETIAALEEIYLRCGQKETHRPT